MIAVNLGLPSNIPLSERAPREWRRHPDAGRDDVFCLVKAEMSDSMMCQDPLLVWPGALLSQYKRFIGLANTTTHLEVPHFEDERRHEIQALMGAMKRDFPDMQRAVSWYQSLLERGDRPHEAFTNLSFLRNVPDDGPSIHDFQLGDRPPAQKPHNLQVVFHRRPL